MDQISSVLPPIKRHWFPAVLAFASVMGGAALYLLTATPTYQSSVRLSVEEPEVSVSAIGQALTAPPGRFSNSTDPMATQAELVKSQRVLNQALQQEALASGIDPSQLPDPWTLSQDLDVSVLPATNILEISYKNSNPKLTSSLLNRIAGEVVAQSSEDIRSEASSIRQFLEQQIPQEQAKLQATEVLETKFREENGIVDVEGQTAKLLDNLSQIQDQERTLAGQLQESKTRGNLLRQMTGFQSPEWAYVASRVGQDPELNALKTRLTDLETQVIAARAKFQDQHPQVQSLLQQRNDLQSLYSNRLSQLVPSLKTIPAGLEAKDQLSQDLISRYVLNTIESSAFDNHLELLKKNRQFLQTQLATVPSRRQRLENIERARTEIQKNLDLLQGKLQEAKIAEAQLLSNVRIIGMAEVPGEPSDPKLSVVLALAIAGGAVLASSVVILLEALNNTVRNTQEIESSTEATVLGILPKQQAHLLRSDEEFPLENFLNSPEVVEPHRRLLKNIELRTVLGSTPHGKAQVLVVTSTVESEGKSDVVARLAAVASMLSRRTLIIDADLLQPLQSELFPIASTVGLAHVIQGQVTLQEAVQPSGLDNLDILPCGELMSRPSTVIESAGMKSLVEEASKYYDLVLIDAAPVAQSSDATTMGQYSNGVLFVVRPNHTVKDTMVDAMQNLRANQIPIAGIVVNETRKLPKIKTTGKGGLKFGQSSEVKLFGSNQFTAR